MSAIPMCQHIQTHKSTFLSWSLFKDWLSAVRMTKSSLINQTVMLVTEEATCSCSLVWSRFFLHEASLKAHWHQSISHSTNEMRKRCFQVQAENWTLAANWFNSRGHLNKSVYVVSSFYFPLESIKKCCLPVLQQPSHTATSGAWFKLLLLFSV